MMVGQIEIDGFAYSFVEAHPLVEGPGGVPVPDTTRRLRVIELETGESSPRVRIVFSEEDWETFTQRIAGSSIEIAQAIPKLNGAG
jgi:hypothetical protein